MQTPVFQSSVKRPGQSLATTSVAGLTPSRLFYVADRSTGLRLLVDIGAEVSVLPPSGIQRLHKQDNFRLQAANNTLIATYGTRSHTLDLGLRRTFRWIFVIADVQKPILGADFLQHFSLFVDLRRKRLVDSTTQLSIQGILTHEPSPTTPRIDYHHSSMNFQMSRRFTLLNPQFNTTSLIISQPLAHRCPHAPAACLPNDSRSPAKSLNTCWKWESSAPHPAVGPPHYIWSLKRHQETGVPVGITER